ncbi:sulfoxide reductase heme-binding subunit YedZ [Monaibacterium marinum]|uniref:Sulfoxide reductase heme-binding subunit YedZ n=1 Tax=Pontivivens marinum TaxID=1690039 RepID=A0A2C9CPY5_9RHOB|nr:ferric reductase-like transmembrane domain-containing protein [Monaibacterium marinum]SOH93581.1 sulfoxide reductase heme-binding subunit YedZ [Monaibacterium marinum]
MNFLKAVLNHPYTFWAILCLPAVPMAIGLSSGDPNAIHSLLHPTGEFAARFMIIAMMVTPLVVMLKQWRGPRWLMKRRRYLGVAAFGYAALHTALYLIDMGSVAVTGGELSKLYIWTGWLAFLIFVPLAITSTDNWVRRLGRRWKALQQFIYAAAVLTLVHWAALHDWGGIAPALVHFGPLVVLQVLRIQAFRRRRDIRQSTAF